MMKTLQTLSVLFAFVLPVLLLGGCGKQVGSISGTVTYKSKPLPSGTITFISASNEVASSPISNNGSYTIPKIAVGPAKITVYTPVIPKGPAGGMSLDKMKGPSEGVAAGPAVTVTPVVIPGKYADPETSNLKYEVVPGPQTHDVSLN